LITTDKLHLAEARMRDRAAKMGGKNTMTTEEILERFNANSKTKAAIRGHADPLQAARPIGSGDHVDN
jgi:hypothetical protein